VVKSIFGGRKNLLLKENVMVSTALDIAIEMDLDACKMRKERKRTIQLPLSLGIVRLGNLFYKYDPQRFVWLGRAASNRDSDAFLTEMVDQVRNFGSGTGHAKVVFAIVRALKGHIDNDKRTIFGNVYNFDIYIALASQGLHFYEFQLRSYRQAVDSWTIVGLRNNVVKDIRKVIGKMIWDAREEAAYSEKKQV
jgi:hypothetical protein